MNKNNIDTFEEDFIDDNKDIEQILKPQCEFKASESLKEEVLRKAENEITPRRSIKLWPWIAAACVAGVLILFLMPPKIKDNVVDPETVTAKIDEPPIIETPQVVETSKPEKAIENIEPQKNPKEFDQVNANTTQQVSNTQQVIEDVSVEEQVQMSEETKIELLLAYLTNTEPEQRDINPEEEIQQMRIRGNRMICQMKIE